MTRRLLLGGLALLGLSGALTRSAPPPASRSEGPVTALCFSPDGASLLSGGYAQVRVRPVAGVAASAVPTDVGATDVRRDGAPRSLPVRLQQVRDFCFHPSGKFLAVAGGEPGAVGGVEVLSWPEGKLLAATPNRRDVVHATAFNGDGSLLAAAGADGEAHLLRLSPIAGGKVLLTPLHQLKAHTAPVLSAAFSPDGRTLLTAGVDRTLRVWDAATGQPQRSFTNHTDAVHCLAFKPAGGAGSAPATAASGSEDRTVRIWQPGIGRMVRIVRGFEGPVLSLVYSRGGERIFCADDTGTISAVDAGSDQVLYSWKAHPGWIYRLALSPDGATLASGDWSGKVRRWDAASGKERP